MSFQNVYDVCAKYMNESGEVSQNDCLEKMIEVFQDSNDSTIHFFYQKAVYLYNMWDDNEMDEHISMVDELIEDVTGYLGEILA